MRQNSPEGVKYFLMLVIGALKEIAKVASLRYFCISISGPQCGLNGFLCVTVLGTTAPWFGLTSVDK